ncbi:MAG: glycosyltransferase [Euryarchaeota archaeon]|nr:glycosyltransferase [Euryarchaeota archaeon]MDE1834977.1 glycosyltransferase [Euryarchaeota archaeon]MDE1880682.1 glycosyltransferase [Euryarchaeota archaeon]MDE2046572.1 glycosyltransferase [Thermoplasmata archaeon]
MAEPSGVPPASSSARTRTVSVILTVLNDRRVERSIKSLLAQTLPPLEVIVADGGSTDGTYEIAERFATSDRRVRPCRLKGNIPESRNQALELVQGEFVAFLDADEVAPPTWLAELLSPFSDPKVGFTGGPTPGMKGTVTNAGSRYYDAYLRRFYDTVARTHPHALPMGNSAWRRRVFQEVGKLDTSLFPRAASEDQDMAHRTLVAGWKGVYVPSAWVDHDFSDISLRSLLRKQATYATGGYVLWRRSGTTYEATGGRLAPYILAPFLVVLGWLVWGVGTLLPPSWHLVPLGAWTLLVGWWVFLLLVLYLTVQGIRWEREYPGSRLRPLEILRRWATLWGALRGLVSYGWSGRRNLPASPRPPPPTGVRPENRDGD